MINFGLSFFVFLIYSTYLLTKNNQTGFEFMVVIPAFFGAILIPLLSWYLYFYVSKYTNYLPKINSFTEFLKMFSMIIPILVCLYLYQFVFVFINSIIIITLGVIFWKFDWKIIYSCIFLYFIFVFYLLVKAKFFSFDLKFIVDLFFPIILIINYYFFPIEILKLSSKLK